MYLQSLFQSLANRLAESSDPEGVIIRGAMEDKRVEAFIRFIRRYAKLVAEVPALESLLDTYAETKTVPDNWREMIGEIRKSETYMSVLQEVEPIISKIRFPSVEEDLIARLLKISEGKPSN